MPEKLNIRCASTNDDGARYAGASRSGGWFVRVSILVILSAVSACGLALDNEQLVARAKQAETEGDLRAAVIDLRTVLQNEPDNIEARLLLGRIALKTGDAFEAEKSLRRAVELGVPTSEVIEDLGLAMLGQRAYQAVLNEIHPNLVEDEDGRRVVLRIRGEAELGLAGGSESATERRSHVDAAQVLFRQVLESDPTDAKARMGLAVSYLTEGRKDEARAEIDQAIDGDPEYVRAYIARGKLDLEAGKVDEAVKDFAKAEELARAQYDVGLTATAIAGLADAHFARNDLTSVKASSERLNAVAPDSVPARYLAARVAIADGDYASAGDHLQQILRVAPDWGPALLLYGSVNLYEGNYQQAEAYFSSVLRSDPQNVRAQRGLAEARYLQDNAEGALQALGPSLGAEDVNSDLLAAGGQLSLRAGDIDAGVELLERAAANDPNNLQRRMDLAVGYITAGDIDRAIQILEEMPEDEESDYRRGVLMVLAMQQRGEIETAQSRLDAMIDDYPDSSALWNLKGGLYQRSGDIGAAADAYAKAIESDQENANAMLNLARLELIQGRDEQAERLYRNALEVRPDNTAALTGLAQVEIRKGDTAAAINLLEKARDASDAALQPRLILGRLYLQVGDLDSAATVASEAFSIGRNDPEAMNLDGLVKMRRGKLPVAEARFREASLARPDEPRFVFNRARALSAMQRPDEAYQLLGEMYPKHPEHAGTAVLYAALLARDNKWEEAYAIAEDLKRRYPDSPMGDSIEADLYKAQRKDAEALTAYEAAMAKKPLLKVALRVSELRMQTGAANPEGPYLTYLETDPSSIEARLMLAQVYQRTDRPAPSIEQYERVLKEDPANAVALNNLAWLYYEQGDNRAESTAAQAYKLASDNPDIVDTYGWILLQNGKNKEALAILREAVANSPTPGTAEIRYHLAVALVKNGEAEEAKGILEELLGSEESFASRAEAASMLKNL